MKYIVVLSLLIAATMTGAAQANTVDIGLFNVPTGSNTFEVRIRPTQNLSGGFSAGIFTIRFPSSYGVTLSVASTAYNFSIQMTGTSAGYDYYGFSGTSFYNVTWNANQEYTLATIQHSSTGMGNGIFELVTGDAWTNAHNGNYYIELNGGNAEKGFYNTQASAPLPVELADFQARLLPNRTVALDWQSKTEHDLSHYAIEHSTDDLNFTEVGTVAAKNTLQQEVNYNFIHTNPRSGNNYYRLRMVDRNGAFEYSAVRSIVLEDKGKNFSLVPTPTTGPLTLLSKNLDQYPTGLKYQLLDNSGKMLMTDNILNEKTDFNLSAYAPGFYYLTIFSDREQLKQFKVVVSKD